MSMDSLQDVTLRLLKISTQKNQKIESILLPLHLQARVTEQNYIHQAIKARLILG
jgi:hypothetical protein